MKNYIIFFVLVLIIISGCETKKNIKLEGAWQVVSWKHIAADTVAWEFPGNATGSDIVIWSKKYVLSVGRFKMDSTYNTNAVGGTYTLDGNKYVETLIYFPDTTKIGHKVTIITEMSNDTLIRMYPVKENGQIDKSNYLIEHLVRLD